MLSRVCWVKVQKTVYRLGSTQAKKSTTAVVKMDMKPNRLVDKVM